MSSPPEHRPTFEEFISDFERYLEGRSTPRLLDLYNADTPEANAARDAYHEGKTCRQDGQCQYAIDHGAEGLGHCPKGQCCYLQPNKGKTL